jgi:hypothetical protein
MIDRLRTTSLIAAMLFALMLALPGAARADDEGPTLRAADTRVEAGGTLRFTGEGFTPEKVISIWASKGDDNYSDGSDPRADKRGRIVFRFAIPHDVEPGDWSMHAEETTSEATPKPSAEPVSFRVIGASRSLMVSPPSGSAGTKFTFSAGGFSDDNKAELEFVAPDNKVYQYTQGGRLSSQDHEWTLVDDENGKVSYSWQAPANAQKGRWLLRLVGNMTKKTRVLGFYIN